MKNVKYELSINFSYFIYQYMLFVFIVGIIYGGRSLFRARTHDFSSNYFHPVFTAIDASALSNVPPLNHRTSPK